MYVFPSTFSYGFFKGGSVGRIWWGPSGEGDRGWEVVLGSGEY